MCVFERERQTDRETVIGRQTAWHVAGDTKTNKQTDEKDRQNRQRQTDGVTDRQIADAFLSVVDQ